MLNNITIDRNEYKYLMSYSDAVNLQKKLDILLHPDAYGDRGVYRVKSLYFDSVNNIDFQEKIAGYEVRKKIRVRIYDEDSPYAKVELKKKQGNYQHKYSLVITREDAETLIKGDYSVLWNYDNETASLLYTTMQLGCYRPVTIVEYERKAYTFPENRTRITFDSHIKSSETNLDLFSKTLPFYPILNEYVVLEVKYAKTLMKFIQKTLSQYPLTNMSISKYCSGRTMYEKIFM